MRATILKKNFQEGLALAERVVPKTPTLPILSAVLCSVESNFIQISATDLEIGIRYKILSKNEQEGSFAVPPRPLGQFVGTLPEGPVALEKKEGGLAIGAGEFQAVFKTLDAEEFPIIPLAKGDENQTHVDAASFCDALASVAGFVGQSQARPEISGVLFSFDKKTLTLASTDSFRLAEKTVPLLKETPGPQVCILPAKASRELLALLGDRPGVLKIFISPTQIIFHYGQDGRPGEPEIQLVSRVIEGEYPKYQEVVPASFETTCVFSRGDLLERVKAAGIFSGKMQDVLLAFDPGKKRVEISTKNPTIGEQHSFLGGDMQGQKLEISFNWRFLADGLAQTKGDHMQFLLSSAEGPALIKSAQDPSYFYVLMPLKI
ncbi:MAG: DNA polymerase III subunit beta [Candidatus Wildermuthbacteria bacterium]|nr:DNA polymerase III subunit beta [Candidatus Wildermuthbacteria bacterium]